MIHIDGYPTIHVLEETAKTLFNLPTAKAPRSVDWGDTSGIDVDLSDGILLQMQEVEVHIMTMQQDELMRLSAQQSITLVIGSIRETILLDAVEMEDVRAGRITAIAKGSIKPTAKGIETLDLNAVGVHVLSATEPYMLGVAPIKRGRTIDLPGRHGARHIEGSAVYLASSECKVRAVMVASDLYALYEHRNTLLGMLISPSGKNIEGLPFSVYYDNCSTDFVGVYSDKAVWEFTIIMQTI